MAICAVLLDERTKDIYIREPMTTYAGSSTYRATSTIEASTKAANDACECTPSRPIYRAMCMHPLLAVALPRECTKLVRSHHQRIPQIHANARLECAVVSGRERRGAPDPTHTHTHPHATSDIWTSPLPADCIDPLPQ